ncbi:hypothetical protein N8I77_003316 [Diaporthe amygdali]|uniref:Apple domain-containing protein n=1 Tax=Phomopsis amygdali TaxID=1214568 RepID=A0AAD9SK35_PHOAM|nr:hypothetical protein N8I77_003316 [Diaporthe amygdali]
MARFNSFHTAFATIVAFAGVVASQTPITSCPTQVKTSTGSSGASYAICAGTDYRGPSAQVLQDVGTIQQCVQMCDAQKGTCVRAVYDNENAICHFKSNQAGALTWVQDSQFSTIVSGGSRAGAGAGQGAPPPTNPGTGSTGTALAQCPTGDQALNTVTGAQFLICQNTDFRGDSASITPAASTESCAELCSQTAACTNAVFDKTNSECHVKADPTTTTLTWVRDQQFDVIRLNMGALGGGASTGGAGFVPTPAAPAKQPPPKQPPPKQPAPAPQPKQNPDPSVDPALIGFLLGGLGAPPPPQQPPPQQAPPPGFATPPPPTTAPPPGFFGIPFIKRESSVSENAGKPRERRVARKFVA